MAKRSDEPSYTPSLAEIDRMKRIVRRENGDAIQQQQPLDIGDWENDDDTSSNEDDDDD